MNGIYRYKKNQPYNWYNKNPSKSNQYCLYCSCLVGDSAEIESNKEHLIGREFVPSGEFLDGSLFNMIFRACKKCNDEKADIERHISSVTLFTSPARNDSQKHDELARRKSEKDYHPGKSGTLIKDSGDEFTISGKFGNANISFGVMVPPQASPQYLKLLSFRHIQGIFSLLTSKNPLTAEGTSLLHHKNFHYHDSYSHLDWGNSQAIEVMSRASKLPCYANIETANGFFKVIMRKQDGKKGEWFWALEWNKNLRVVGAIGQPNVTPRIFKDLPDFAFDDLGIQEGMNTRMRREIALTPELDRLFTGKVENEKKG